MTLCPSLTPDSYRLIDPVLYCYARKVLKRHTNNRVFDSGFVSGDVEDEPKLLVGGISQVPAGYSVVKLH